jgi:hypothetical protein
MIHMHKLRVLGLAFVAVIAFSAVVASAASALEFKAEKYPVTVHGTGSGIGEKFVTEAGAVECEVSHFHGVQTEAEHIANPSTLTVHPEYTGCKAFGFLGATITTTGCNYLFHVASKTSVDNYALKVDVECSAGSSIKIVASTCSAEVKAQTGLSSVNVLDTTTASPKRDVDVTPAVKGIAYTVTNDGFLCPFNGTGAKTGGEYSVESGKSITITGQNPSNAAEKIGIEVLG